MITMNPSALRRVKRPMKISMAPKNSVEATSVAQNIPGKNPIRFSHSSANRSSPFPSNYPKSFCAPCAKNMLPSAIRSGSASQPAWVRVRRSKSFFILGSIARSRNTFPKQQIVSSQNTFTNELPQIAKISQIPLRKGNVIFMLVLNGDNGGRKSMA